jgi:hypothetical protein
MRFSPGNDEERLDIGEKGFQRQKMDRGILWWLYSEEPLGYLGSHLAFLSVPFVLAHGREHHPKEPKLSSAGPGLKEKEVIFLSLVWPFGSALSIFQRVPQPGIPSHWCVDSVIPFWLGEYHSTILRIGAGIKVRAIKVFVAFQSHHRASPLDSAPVLTESPVSHSQSSLAYRNAIFCDGNRWWMDIVAFVGFVQCNDQTGVPVFDAKLVYLVSIGSIFDRKTTLFGFFHGIDW